MFPRGGRGKGCLSGFASVGYGGAYGLYAVYMGVLALLFDRVVLGLPKGSSKGFIMVSMVLLYGLEGLTSCLHVRFLIVFPRGCTGVNKGPYTGVLPCVVPRALWPSRKLLSPCTNK